MNSDETMFCPIYDKYLTEMITQKNKIGNSDKKKLNIMIKFAKTFTLLPEQWSELLRLSKKCNISLSKNLNLCLYSTVYGNKLSKNIEWSNHESIICNSRDPKMSNWFKTAKEALTFPHKHLLKIYREYYFCSVKQVKKEIYKTFLSNKEIYNSMIKFDNNIEEWYDCVKKISNPEAVIANFELKIGQNSNWKIKNLWNFYFQFLKENHLKEILDVYRKYTRLFISDVEVVEDYQNEIEKFSMWNEPTTKYWIDTIKYEIDFGNLKFAYRILERALKAVLGKSYHFEVKEKNDLFKIFKKHEIEMKEIENLRHSSKPQVNKVPSSTKPTVHFQNPSLQYFCFHRAFIWNLLKTANSVVLRKLYATCKFLFSIQRAPLCHRLEIRNDIATTFCEESLFLNEKDVDFAGLKNLDICHNICTMRCQNRTALSQILPKLKRCRLRSAQIFKQDLLISQFRFFLSAATPFSIHCYDSNILDKNGKLIDATKLLETVHEYVLLKFFNFFNQSYFILFSPSPVKKQSWNVIQSFRQFRYQFIYMANQVCSISQLEFLIDYEMLKEITLKNTTVKDGNDQKMEKREIEEFIKSHVLPANRVVMSIV